MLCAISPRVSLAPVRDPILTHLEWARRIARLIGRHYGFSGSELEDLESVAIVELVDRARRFDYSRLRPGETMEDRLRGHVHTYLRGAVQRHAIQLRNGGTYRTRRENEHASPIVVEGLPVERDGDDPTVVTVPDHRPAVDPGADLSRLPADWRDRVTVADAPAVPHAERPSLAALKARATRRR